MLIIYSQWQFILKLRINCTTNMKTLTYIKKVYNTWIFFIKDYSDFDIAIIFFLYSAKYVYWDITRGNIFKKVSRTGEIKRNHKFGPINWRTHPNFIRYPYYERITYHLFRSLSVVVDNGDTTSSSQLHICQR